MWLASCSAAAGFRAGRNGDIEKSMREAAREALLRSSNQASKPVGTSSAPRSDAGGAEARAVILVSRQGVDEEQNSFSRTRQIDGLME